MKTMIVLCTSENLYAESSNILSDIVHCSIFSQIAYMH